jgi:hypothetical protein
VANYIQTKFQEVLIFILIRSKWNFFSAMKPTKLLT